MVNHTPEQSPIPFNVEDYAPGMVDITRPEVQQILDGSLGDRILFENLMAIRSIWDAAEERATIQARPDDMEKRRLRQRFDAVVERRRELGDIERR